MGKSERRHAHRLAPLGYGPRRANRCDTLRRLKALGAGVSASGGYFVEVTGRVAPLRAILESGVHFGYGSDGGSVAPLAPWLHMHYIVTGKNAAGVVVNPGQTLTRLQALHAFTIDNAWFTGDEDKLGSLEVGKLGDVAILSGDFLIPPASPTMPSSICRP